MPPSDSAHDLLNAHSSNTSIADGSKTASCAFDAIACCQTDPDRQWVLSLPYALRFLLTYRPELHEPVLGIAHRAIGSFLKSRCGFKAADPSIHTGAITFIQRFGSALNLNVHLHCLVLDGVYRIAPHSTRFVALPVIEKTDIAKLLQRISQRVVRKLLKLGFLEVDDNERLSHLSERIEPEPFNDLLGQSITYRVATGPRRGQKALTLKTLYAANDDNQSPKLSARDPESGFSLHAGVSTRAHQTRKRIHLIRYLARPPVADNRLAVNTHGQAIYELKSPYRDGTTHAVFEPIEFIARLAALVPKPRYHLARYRGLFTANQKFRKRLLR